MGRLIDKLLDLGTSGAFLICYIGCALAVIEVIGLSTGAYSFSMPHNSKNEGMLRDVYMHCSRMSYTDTPCASLMTEFEKYKSKNK